VDIKYQLDADVPASAVR